MDIDRPSTVSSATNPDTTATNPDTPRIGPGRGRELAALARLGAAVGARVSGTRDVHLFSTLGRARRTFAPWLVYSGSMMPFGALARTDTELVILRVAHLRGSTYERAHHERIGARVGLGAAEIERTTADPATADWSPARRAMLTATDQLVAGRDVDDATWAELRAHLDEAEAIALLQLVTQYDGLATVLHTLRVQPDQPR